MLSDVRQRTEHMTKIYQELSGVVQDPNIKEALELRVFLQDKILSSLDRCFKLIGEKPVALSGVFTTFSSRIFGARLPRFQAPAAKALFVLVKANQLMHLRIAEYVALIAMADVTGHFGVGVLLGKLPRLQARFRRTALRPNFGSPAGRFFRLCYGGGLAAPTLLSKVIGGFLPIAPWGRSSL